MSERIAVPLAAATLALLIAPWAARAAVPIPSGPASGAATSEPMAQPGDGLAESSADLPTRAVTEPSLVEGGRAEPAPEVFQPPPQEARQLGKPVRVFIPRAADERDDSSLNPLRALDPRSNEVTRVAAALAVVLGLLLLLRAMLRRIGGSLGGGGRPSGVLEVLARYPVARGQHLVLLKLGRRIVLLYHAKSAMTTLSEVCDPEEVAGLLARIEASSRSKRAGRFQALLNRFAAEGRPGHDSGFPLGHPAGGGLEGSEVIDLTRRPHRARSSSGPLVRRGSP